MKKILILILFIIMVSSCKITPYDGNELSAPTFLKEELTKIEK